MGARPKSLNHGTVTQLARYCAFRAEHLAAPVASEMELEQMAQINLERALGMSYPVKLPVELPVIADARMMPHEWILLSDGRLQKLDASDHGDNHFFPGPTDIAWDVAGAIVEWRLNSEAVELLTSEYRAITHDALTNRLPSYLIAYSCFRMAFAQSAANSTSDATERTRLQRDANGYTATLTNLLERFAPSLGTGAII
jgi:hypothetical protein